MKNLFLALSVFLLAQNLSAQEWRDLGTYGFFADTQSPEMTVLANGTPIAAYKDGGGNIKVLQWKYDNWQTLVAPSSDPVDYIRVTSAGDVFFVGFKNLTTGNFEVYKYIGGAWELLGDLSSVTWVLGNIDIDATELAPDQVNLIFFTDDISNAEIIQWDGGTWNSISIDFLSTSGGPLSQTKFDLEDNNTEAFVATLQDDGALKEIRFYKDAGGAYEGFNHLGDPFLVQNPITFGTDAAAGMNPFVAYVPNADPTTIYLAEADIASSELIDHPTFDVGGTVVGHFNMAVNADNHVLVAYQLDDNITRVAKYDGVTWFEITASLDELNMGEYDVDIFKASGKPYLLYRDLLGNTGVKTLNNSPTYITSDAPVPNCAGGSSDLIIANIQFNDVDHDSLYLDFNVVSGSLLASEIEYNRTSVYSPFSGENTFEILTSPSFAGSSVVEIMAIDGLDTTIYTETFIVNPTPAAITFSPGVDPSTCGATDGTINISGLDITTSYALNYYKDGSPVSYGTFVSSATGDHTVSGLTAGSYDQFYITYDLTGCGTLFTATVVLSEPVAPVFTVSTSDALSCGAAGFVHLNGLSPSTTYDLVTWDWNGYESAGYEISPTTGTSGELTFTNNVGVIENIVVKQGGCEGYVSGPYEIGEPDAADIVITTSPATCGSSDGAIDATITGGLSPYDIYWSNGAITEDIADVSATTYYINVTDANGCYSMGVATVGVSTISISESVGNVSCPGGADGFVILTPTGTGPFTYFWSNGATTQEIAGLTAGQYEVFITDATGCMTTASYIITEPDPIEALFASSPASCGTADGAISSTISGGTFPYSFNWYDDLGSLIGTTSSISGQAAGSYGLEVTDDNACVQVLNTTISNIGSPLISINSLTASSCAGDGEMDITATPTTAATITSYAWNTGETTQDLSGKPAGYYFVEVVDDLGCMAVKGMHVPAKKPAIQPICIVTVDTTTNTNRVVWEKPVSTEIDHYNIYRESSVAGMFQFVDQVPYSSESFFTDPIAYPQLRSWRYKISAVNNCGIESYKSEDHKTIHTVFTETTPGTFEVNWDAYEGFTYPEYVVWRFTDADGWVEATTQSSALPTTFTDSPTTTAGIDYMIEITPPASCESTGKATDHNSSRSNKTSSIAGPPGGSSDLGINESGILNISVYPNPMTDQLNVAIGNDIIVHAINVFDLSGNLIYTTNANQKAYSIDLSNVEASIYLLEVITENGTFNQKVIKQ